MLSDFSFADDTIGFIIEGNVDSEVMQNLGRGIQVSLVENKKVNLYLEDSNIKSFSVSSILKGTFFPFKNGSKFNKMALISDRKWIHAIGTFHNLLFSFEVKSFSTQDRVVAMSWIMER
jgi:hypothetical protein